MRRSSTDLVIEGIIVDASGEALAVINGELRRAGDAVGEANIIQIFEDRLILSQDDEEKTIWLREEIVEGA